MLGKLFPKILLLELLILAKTLGPFLKPLHILIIPLGKQFQRLILDPLLTMLQKVKAAAHKKQEKQAALLSSAITKQIAALHGQKKQTA
jgi:hypothetical protein